MEFKEFVLNEETANVIGEQLKEFLPALESYIVENITFFLEDNLEDTLKNIRIFTNVAVQEILDQLNTAAYLESVQEIQEAEEEVKKYL